MGETSIIDAKKWTSPYQKVGGFASFCTLTTHKFAPRDKLDLLAINKDKHDDFSRLANNLVQID